MITETGKQCVVGGRPTGDSAQRKMQRSRRTHRVAPIGAITKIPDEQGGMRNRATPGVVVPEACVARGQDAKLRRCAESRKKRNGNKPRCGDEDVLEKTIFLPGLPTTGHAQSAIFLSFSSTCRSTCLGSGGKGRCRPRCSRPRSR